MAGQDFGNAIFGMFDMLAPGVMATSIIDVFSRVLGMIYLFGKVAGPLQPVSTLVVARSSHRVTRPTGEVGYRQGEKLVRPNLREHLVDGIRPASGGCRI